MTEESIFAGALAKPTAAERLAFVEAACAGDAVLRQRMVNLLQSHAEAGAFLNEPVVMQVAPPAPAATHADSAPPAPASAGSSTDETQADARAASGAGVLLDWLGPPQAPHQLGRLAHYDILEVLGKGGFGTVLKAFDEKLHRMVAIKVLAPELAASGSARQRFIREARTAAAVTHDHVVTIHVVDEDHRPPYIVMQLIDGVTLQQKLDKAGALTLKEILRIGVQTAQGLAAAHKQGLVHRDIKPANILLENGVERVKITDFGLARAVDDASVTQSGVVAGTPMYMSPEQAEGLPIDHRSDLFSLGTVLYAMCTGHPPFRASGTHAVLKRVIDASPRPIREINSEIPEWLCAIIGKLHAKKPEDRFQTAKEVAEVLGQRLADVQAGRATDESIRGSDRSEAPAAVAPTPIDQVPGSPTPFARAAGPSRRLYWLISGLLAASVLVILANEAQRWLADADFSVASDDPDSRVIITDMEGAVLHELSGSTAWPITLRPETYTLAIRPGPRRKFQVVGWAGSGNKTFKETRLLPDGRQEHRFDVTFQRGKRLVVSIKTSFLADPPPEEPGWVQLFNGKDLSGWTNAPYGKTHWKVENGNLVANGHAALHSVRDLRNFHARVECKVGAGATFGFGFRSTPELGMATALAPTNVGSIWMYRRGVASQPVTSVQLEPPLEQVLLSDTDWATVEAIVLDNKATILVNGRKTAQQDIKDMPEKGELRLSSNVDATHVVIRKVEIKEILPNPKPAFAIAPFDAKQAKEHQDAWAKHLGVDVEITNSIGMKMRLIPPGEFTMGTAAAAIAKIKKDLKQAGEGKDVRGYVDREGPAHLVRITKPWRFGAHEVTVAQFRRFVDETGYKTEAERDGKGGKVYVADSDDARFDPKTSWRNPGPFEAKDESPVVQVSWNDAREFCLWLSKKEGRVYRLATEAEWEFACRAGSAGAYSFSDPFALKEHIVFEEKAPTKVGSRKANPFGLFDMEGNVSEWCADFNAERYAGVAETDPTGPATGDGRIYRGGSYDSLAWSCRSAMRWADPPADRYANTGFRVVLLAHNELPQPAPAVAPFDAKQAKEHQDAWAKHLGVDVEITNTIGMKLRLIPPSEFKMGSTLEQNKALKKMLRDDESPDRVGQEAILDFERPQNSVRLTKPYRIGMHEVTVEQFRQFVEAKKYQTDAERDGKGGVVRSDGKYIDAPGTSWRKPGEFEVQDKQPVVQVSWNDAEAFCRWLSTKEGRRYRLATEAEWEFAARAGSDGLYSSGDDAFEHARRAVCNNVNSPLTVGSMKPNPFGLFDMEGNVWEWVADWSETYSGAAEVNPVGPLKGKYRVCRGGSFINKPWTCRPAIRNSDLPAARYFDTGFRVVLEADEPNTPLAVAPFDAKKAKEH